MIGGGINRMGRIGKVKKERGIDFFMRKRFKNHGFKRFFKKYLVWFITFSIASWIASSIIEGIDINFFLLMFIAGFVIESSSKIMQIFVFNHSWKINKHYIFWIFIQSISFFISTFLVSYISESINFNLFTNFLIIGLFTTMVVRIIWKTNLEKKIFSGNGKNFLILILIIIILVLVINYSQMGTNIFLKNISAKNTTLENNQLSMVAKNSDLIKNYEKLTCGMKIDEIEKLFGEGNKTGQEEYGSEILHYREAGLYLTFYFDLSKGKLNNVFLGDTTTGSSIEKIHCAQDNPSVDEKVISEIGSVINKNVGNKNVREDSFWESLKNFFKRFNLNPNSCPQLDIPLLKGGLGHYITEMKDLDMSENRFFQDKEKFEYYVQRDIENDTSDPQKGWEISVYSASSLLGIEISKVYCHKGNVEGENPNYFYCDSGITGGIPYLSKTQMNPDGTIGKTIRKSFINVYDSDKKFIKTICGKSPEDIAEEEFKQTMRELDDFFSLD